MSELNSTQVHETLRYDQETGNFIWLVSKGSKKAGEIAGTINDDGYIIIRVNGKRYMAHRIAWFLLKGKMPDGDIDHINGNRKDNRIENLRDVSRSVNLQNQRSPRNGNKYLGVTWDKRNKKWFSQITVGHKHINIGRFNTAEEAHAAYVATKRKLHEGCTI